MARWASLIKKRRGESPVLLVDTGDFCTARRVRYQNIKDRCFFKGMKRMRYDAVGIGGNEIRFGRGRLLETARSIKIPLVSSNIIDKRSGDYLAARSIIKKVGGKRTLFGRKGAIKVGFLGVVLPGFIHSVSEDAKKFYSVKNVKIAALEEITKLREKGCDLIVVLSNQGWEKSLALAEQVPGIDIVINGHRAHGGTYMERVGETVVVDTGIKRSSFTEINVIFGEGPPRIDAVDMGKVILSSEGDPWLIELEELCEEELRQAKLERHKG